MFPLSLGLSDGSSQATQSGAGDFSAGMGGSFSFNNAFQVGGRGNSSQEGGAEAKSDNTPAGTMSNSKLLIIGGLALVAMIGLVAVMPQR